MESFLKTSFHDFDDADEVSTNDLDENESGRFMNSRNQNILSDIYPSRKYGNNLSPSKIYFEDQNNDENRNEEFSLSDVNYMFSPKMKKKIYPNYDTQSNHSISQTKLDDEKEKEYIEKIQILLNKYNLKKEELKVQKALMESREDQRKSLQDQLNKATIEVAHLRLVQEDLNSSLKQTNAKNQYLTKELKKTREEYEKKENSQQRDLNILKEAFETKQNEVEALQRNCNLAIEQLKSKNSTLQAALNSARNQMNKFQDENFKLFNESKTITSQFESEKSNFLNQQKNLTDLENRYQKVSSDLANFRELNEKLNLSLMQLQNDVHTLTAENRRFAQDRDTIEHQAKSLDKKLKTATQESQENQVKLYDALTKISALNDEIAHNQQLLEKTKTNLTSDINKLLEQIYLDKTKEDELKEQYRQLKNELNEKTSELKCEQQKREILEQSEKATKQQADKIEKLYQQGEEERIRLKDTINGLNEEIATKNNQNEEVHLKLRDLIEKNNDLNSQIQNLEEMKKEIVPYNSNEINELKYQNNELLSANNSLKDIISSLSSKIKSEKSTIEQLNRDKQKDQENIEELTTSINRKMTELQASIEERKDLHAEIQKSQSQLSELKRVHRQLETEMHKIRIENQHYNRIIKEKEEKIATLVESNQHFQNQFNEAKQQLNELKSSNTLLKNENQSLLTEIDNMKLEIKSTQDRVKQLVATTQSLNESNETMKQRIQKFETDNKSLNSVVNELNQTNEQISNNLSHEMQLKEKALLNENKLKNQMKTVLAYQKAMDTELTNTKTTLEAKSKQVTDLQLENDQLKTKMANLKFQNESKEKENDQLNTKIQEAETRLSAEKEKAQCLEEQLEKNTQTIVPSLTKRISLLEERLKDKEAENQHSIDQANHLEGLLNNMQSIQEGSQQKIADLGKKIFTYQQQLSEKEICEKSTFLQMNDLSRMINEVRDENTQLLEQMRKLEENNKNEQIKQNHKYLDDISKLKAKHLINIEEMKKAESLQKKQNRELQNQISEKEKANFQLDTKLKALELELNSCNHQIEELSKNKDEIMKERNELKTKFIIQKHQITNLENEKVKLAKDKNDLLHQIDELQLEKDELINEQRKFMNAAMRLKQSENQIEKMKQQIQTLSSLNEKLSIEVVESQKTRDQTSKEFTKMTETMQNIQSLLMKDESYLHTVKKNIE